MFKCQNCGEQQGPREPATRVIVEERPRTYLHDHREPTRGTEIVKELLMCEECSKTEWVEIEV